ncbi:MAG: hypothetical protein N2050_04805 [Flavobacteriales bacterium]|nr:hypothetical protein [Flavobacteriales bacterium]
MNIGKELLNVPFPAMVKNLGLGIAEAQFALDIAAIRIAQQMSGVRLDKSGKLVRDESLLIKLKEGDEGISLLALGFTPTFYQFVDSEISLRMDMRFMEEKSFGFGASITASANFLFGSVAASVNASYSQKYQFEASGSSELRTRLVTVPPPPGFQEQLRNLLAEKDEKPEGENT